MTTTDTVVRARIDLKTKNQAAKALAAMGLSVSDYIRIALVRVARDKAVPFEVRVPNAPTAETLRKSARGEDVHTAPQPASPRQKGSVRGRVWRGRPSLAR